MKSVYLDYAAATPMDPKVLDSMLPYFSGKFYNPSATYLASKAVKRDLNESRQAIARWLGSKPTEIYFTAGATEANNMAIAGIMRKYPDAEVLVSSIEHDSVMAPAEQFNCNKIAATAKGIVDLQPFKKKIKPNTVLISVMLVNNELGTVQPIREIAKMVADVRVERIRKGNKLPLYLHTDAAQAGNYFDLHVSRLGVDMLSLNGGKIYGPKQTGVLYIRAGIELLPIIAGGGQEHGLRSGTENVPGFIGLAKALDIAQSKKDKEAARVRELRNIFVSELASQVPYVQVNGAVKHIASHIIHVSFSQGTDNDRLMMELDERGVQCAVGSACSASSSKPSHVLSAIGMSDELARTSLRFSLGRTTSKKDILKTIRLLKSLLNT
jgi:cysteine desulfurase